MSPEQRLQVQANLNSAIEQTRKRHPNLSNALVYSIAERENRAIFKAATIETGPVEVEAGAVPTADDLKRQDDLADAIGELMRRNPGMTWAHACQLLANSQPDLFAPPGLTGKKAKEYLAKKRKVQDMQQAIDDAIDAMREKNQSLSFEAAWDKLRATKPEMFAFDEG
jgi:hypothetical protein